MKPRYGFLVVIVLAATNAKCQSGDGFLSVLIHAAHHPDMVWTSGIHPFVEVSLSPPSEGYGFELMPSAGVALQYPHFMLDADASYGFVRKVDDNDQVPHEHGHTRGLSADISWRMGRNFIGPGASWGESAETPYRKYSWAPAAFAGHDFNSMRITASYFRSLREYVDYPSLVYFTPGPGQPSLSPYCICSNGVSGVGFDLWQAPSEKARAHLLLHYSLSVIHFYDTVTDPYNSVLTAEQKANTNIGGSVSFGVIYRR